MSSATWHEVRCTAGASAPGAFTCKHNHPNYNQHVWVWMRLCPVYGLPVSLQAQLQGQIRWPSQLKRHTVCSNAGFLFFGTVLRAIAAADGLRSSQNGPEGSPSLQKSFLQPVQGLILDSAPCRLTPDISARFVTHPEAHPGTFALPNALLPLIVLSASWWSAQHQICLHDAVPLFVMHSHPSCFRGFTAAALSKPAESIAQQHPRLVSAAQLLFMPVLKLPLIANRQDQVRRLTQHMSAYLLLRYMSCLTSNMQ